MIRQQCFQLNDTTIICLYTINIVYFVFAIRFYITTLGNLNGLKLYSTRIIYATFHMNMVFFSIRSVNYIVHSTE